MFAIVVFVEGSNRHNRHNREKQGHNETNDKEQIAIRARESEIEERDHHVVMIAFGDTRLRNVNRNLT